MKNTPRTLGLKITNKLNLTYRKEDTNKAVVANNNNQCSCRLLKKSTKIKE
jgi:hypothetical protein